MIAAAETDRDIIYFAFHDEEAFKKLEKISNILKTMSVSQMYELIGEYANEISDLKLQEIQRFGIAEFLSTKLTKT
jgi:hypothetical protein